jgi:AcrR family transcriptional regulator
MVTTNSRAALVDAAFEEFTTKGYEAATVAGIAERAGVTTGALYAHFAGKLDLLLATVGLTPIADIARSVGGGSGWGSMGKGLSERPDRRRVLLLDVIVVARRDPEVAEILRGGLEAYVRATARVIEAASAGGRVDPVVSPEGVSRLLAVLNLGMVVFAALDARTPPASGFERLVGALLPPSSGAGGSAGAVASEEPGALAEVEALAAAVAVAQDALHDGIAAAIDEGHSLRQVGTSAGLSHEAVRRIAARVGDERSA